MLPASSRTLPSQSISSSKVWAQPLALRAAYNVHHTEFIGAAPVKKVLDREGVAQEISQVVAVWSRYEARFRGSARSLGVGLGLAS